VRADVRQVLHNDYSAGLDGIDDVPTEYVVAILAEAVDLPGQLAEMPLGRASAFRLKRTLQSEVPAIDFTPAPRAKETIVGADGWTVQANIHPDYIARRLELYVCKRDNDMQPEATFAPDQVSAVKLNGLLQETLSVGIDNEWYFKPSSYRGQAGNAMLRLDGIGAGIIADRDKRGSWTRYLAAPLLKCKGRLHCLSCPDTRCDNQLRRETRKPLTNIIVSGVMQPDTVLFRMVPAICGDGIEARRVLV
jgi:hypothetical protein